MEKESQEKLGFFQKYKTQILVSFGILGLFFSLCVGFVVYGYFLLSEPVNVGKNKVVLIKKGQTASQIAKILEKENIIRHNFLFNIAIRYLQKEKDIRHGEYAIPESVNVFDVIDVFVQGQSIKHRITFSEGMTSWEVVQKLNSDERLLKHIRDIPLEGSLLPETYVFTHGTDKNDIIKWMQEAQRNFLRDHWSKRQKDLPYSSQREAIILASIIEKETAKEEERGLVASVFVNRLKKGMRLQSDPTIVYGITLGKKKLGRPLKKSEIRMKNDYNTYVIKGLPKNAIANPGKDAILATLNPEKSDKYYFVASGDGGHHFSSQYKQHLKYVKKLRMLEKQKRQ